MTLFIVTQPLGICYKNRMKNSQNFYKLDNNGLKC